MKDRLDSAHSHRKPSSAGRKNAAPAYRGWNAARSHLGLRALSLACAAFFVRSETACSDGFRCERAESLQSFMNNPG